jgi:TolB protein
MDADGSNVVNLTGEIAGVHVFPKWSPDSNLIAFTSIQNSGANIWLIDADTLAITQVTTDPTGAYEVDWSPDASHLVYFSARYGNANLYSISIDGSNEMQLTDGPGDDEAPAWSPDGNQIAFISTRGWLGWLLLSLSNGR